MDRSIAPGSEIPSSLLWRRMVGLPVFTAVLVLLVSWGLGDEMPLNGIFWLLLAVALGVGGTLGLAFDSKDRPLSVSLGVMSIGSLGVAAILVSSLPDATFLTVAFPSLGLLVAYLVASSARQLWLRAHPVSVDPS